MALDVALALTVVAIAIAARPWRALPPQGPPWVWIVAWALLPWLWSADHLARSAPLPPLSGASLLVLLAGWPLSVPALVAAAVACVASGLVAWGEAIITGMLVSIFVALRPQWLATYSDTLYLPR